MVGSLWLVRCTLLPAQRTAAVEEVRLLMSVDHPNVVSCWRLLLTLEKGEFPAAAPATFMVAHLPAAEG